MFFISIPKIQPRRWTKFGSKAADKNWKLYFTTLFWNLNFWDNASTLAGEVDTPEKTFPLALLLSGIIISIGYIVPLLAGTGALDVEDSQWTDGFLADAAGMIAGNWLKMWVEVGAVLSTVGLFEAQLSSGSYQLLGTAELGFLPRFFAARSSWFGTPWVGILTSSAVTLGISYLSFGQIISTANCLYSLGMLLEFSSFIWLRRKYPSIDRPFRVGLSLPGLVCMLVVPTGFLFYVITIAGKLAYAISGALTVIGVLGYFAMRWCKTNGWVAFVDGAAKVEAKAVVQVEGEEA